MKDNQVLFLTLKVFSATGGIEKVCRIVGKALYEYGVENNRAVQVYTMHGNKTAGNGNRYFPSEIFKGFNGQKLHCIISSVRKGCGSRVVLMSHINLLPIGWLIKKVSPSTKVILFAHGIEIWKPLNRVKRMLLNSCDQIISVSRYTADKIKELHNFPDAKIQVINNCLDPFLPLQDNISASELLRKRYGFKTSDKILFTLTRLSAKERYKGYDCVMEALVDLKIKYPEIKYLLAGSYDAEEKEYLDAIIKKLDLGQQVVMAGYIADEEIADHFSMADVYVMPSMKEGFGIVFIEAMYYKLPAIAGNMDGSVDAMLDGELGLLVDPRDITAIRNAIELVLKDKAAYIPDRKKLLENFSFESYKRKLERVVSV